VTRESICSLRILVQFTDGYRTTEPKENPHCLKADFDSDSFLCFGDIAVII